jgi:hypothetical protein
VRRYYASLSYLAQSWKKPRRVVAKIEWHPGELYPRVGFIVTNLARPAERIVGFYNHRGTCEQYIKEGKVDASAVVTIATLAHALIGNRPIDPSVTFGTDRRKSY